MKHLALVWLVLSAGSFPAWAISAPDQAARDTALNWLAIVDTGQYSKAWNAYPPRIKAGRLEENFKGWMRARRFPLGHAKTRQFLKITHTHRLNGAPDGDYQLIAFKTSFERKAVALEEVVLTSETGHWQVSGYAFR